MKLLSSVVSCLAAAVCGAQAATLVVHWSTDSDRLLYSRNLVPLSAGGPASGDGTLIELGFYSMASDSNPFGGDWHILATATIGDFGIESAGKFDVTSNLTAGTFIEPLAGSPLAVRFYDGPSVSASTYFNAVSVNNGTWDYVSPAEPQTSLDLVISKGSSTVWAGGQGSDYRTYLTVPEPSVPLLSILAAIKLTLLSRRRKAHTAR